METEAIPPGVGVHVPAKPGVVADIGIGLTIIPEAGKFLLIRVQQERLTYH
jgi:hypothetical protein